MNMSNDNYYSTQDEQPLQVLIQKARQIDKQNKQKEQPTIQQKSKPTYLNNTFELRKGLQKTLTQVEDMNKKEKKRNHHHFEKKNPVKFALEKLKSTSNGYSDQNEENYQRLYSPQPQKKQGNGKVFSRLFQDTQNQKNDHDQSLQVSQQNGKSELNELKSKPKISKKSTELAENKFKKFLSSADCIVFSQYLKEKTLNLIYKKHQYTQTSENSKDLITLSFQTKNNQKNANNQQNQAQTKMKKIHKKSYEEKSKEDETDRQQKIFAEKEMQTIESGFKQQDTPPKKSKKSSRSNSILSSQKKSNYIPIYERYEFILQEKRAHIAELQKELEYIKNDKFYFVSEEKQNQTMPIKKNSENGRLMDKDRLEEFLDSQSKWLQRKNTRIQNARIANQSHKNNSQIALEAENQKNSFKPVINERSKELVKQKYANIGFLERNEIFEDEKRRKLEEHLSELEPSHQPILSPHSRVMYDHSQEKKSKVLFQSSQWCEDSLQY